MTYKCDDNSDLNCIESATYGTADMVGLIDMFHCIAELCAQEKSASIMVDHSELDVRPLTMEEAGNLSNITVGAKDIFKMRKCAHVATNDFHFGLVRTWEIMVEIIGLNDLNTMVFKNRDDAIKWIKASS